jgi:hypothetical protein
METYIVTQRVAVTVECYSSHTYAERPTAFIWKGQRYSIAKILKQWRSPEGPGFSVVTAQGTRFELTYNDTQDEWSLCCLVVAHGLVDSPPARAEATTDAEPLNQPD